MKHYHALLHFLILGTLLSGCGKPEEEEKAPEPTPTVTVQALHRGDIEESITAYGSVVAEPGQSTGLSVPYEGMVTRTWVVPGQPIKAGDPIVEIAASAATELQVGQAQTALKSAETELQQVRQRYDLKLATNQELSQAQRATDDARAQLASLEKNGAAGPRDLKSPVDGIVVGLSAQAGQTVSAGMSLADIVARDAIEVRLEVEPDDLDALKVGGNLKLIPVNQPSARSVAGVVRMLTASVNPASRLVSVYVTLPKDSGFLLGGYVQAEFARRAEGVWVVPIAALLSEGEGTHLFLARDGKAVAQPVEIGLRNKDVAEVRAKALKDADAVVVEGNYELEDGMNLKTK